MGGGLTRVLLFFILLAAAFLGRALFTSQVLLPLDDLFLYPPWRAYAAQFGVTVPNNHLIADTILQNYGWKAFAARAFADGQLPLWNPYILAGQPFLAAGQNASLYPAGVLYSILPNGRAYAWFIALHLVLAGLLAFWFTRVLGGCRFGGLVSGVTFAFCGFLVVSILWPMVVSTAVWLPGVLAVSELLIRRLAGPPAERPRPNTIPLVLLGAAMITLQFLAGHLEMSLYLLATSGLYAALRLLGLALGRAATPYSAARRGRVALAGLTLLGMVALGCLGAAVQLIPFREAIAANVRAGQVSVDDVRGWALPREQLLAFLAPDIFGNPTHHALFDLFSGARRPLDPPLGAGEEGRYGTEWGVKNYVEGTAYLGILPLLLAPVALLTRRDAPTRALALIAAVALLLAFGTPVYALLFFSVPGVNQLHTPFRWIYPYSLCVATLAGLGASALVAGRRPPRLAVAIGWLGAALGILGLMAALGGWLGRAALLDLAARALRRSAALAQAFPDAQALYSYQWANLTGLALLLLASGLLVLALARRAPAARALALGLLVADLFSFGYGFNTVADPAPLAFVPPEIAAIQADPELFRIATLGERDVLPANTGMLFGLQDIRGYDTILLRDYVQYLELIEPQRGLLYSKIDKLRDPRSLASPLLDLLNVKYVLTTERVDSPSWSLVIDGAVRVYRNERVLPRAFLVEQATVANGPSEALELLARPGFDPRREVILEAEAPPAVEALAGAPPATPARITRYEPNRVEIEATAPRSGYLVLTDLAFPGWRAWVDGVEQPILRADRIFRAVQLPPGHHLVVFEYRPFTVRVGALLSLLAVALGALLLGVWGYARLELGERLGAGTVGRVAKNSLFPLATGLLNKALDFAFALVYLRILGPQGTGAYTFAVVVFGYFDILVNFGLSTLLTREVARDGAQSDRYFASTLITRLGLAMLTLLAALALAGPLAAPLHIETEVGLAIVLLTLGMLPGAFSSTSSALFMARERMEVPAAVTVLSTLLKIGLGTAALLAGWGIVGLAAVSLVVNIITAVVLGAAQVALLGRPRLRLERRFSLELLAVAWPLMLNNFLNSLFYRIDAVLLKPLAGEVALGHYSTAYKFIDGLQIIPSTFVLALFPVLARQAAGRRAELARAFGLGLKVLLALALPISVGTTLLAEPIIGLLAGPAYLPDSAHALQVLIWFLPFSFMNGLTQYVLIALNRQRWITLSFFLGAAANIVLNLWLIPRYGYLGAAVVTVASEWVLFVPFWHVVRQELPPIPLLGILWRPALAAGVMGLVVLGVREVNPWLAVPVGAAVYAAALLALGTISREEAAALRQRSIPSR